MPHQFPENSKRETGKPIKQLRKRAPRISTRSFPREKIPLQSFYDIPSEMVKHFNVGRVDNMAAVFNKYMHERCLFRVNDTLTISEFVGTDCITAFFASLLHAYPDAVLTSRKVKAFTVDQYIVIQCKLVFVGTEVTPTAAKELLCHKAHEDDVDHKAADFMLNLSPEEREQMLRYEEEIEKSGKKKQMTCKSLFTMYIDPAVNRSVLNDTAYRVVGIRGLGP